MKKVNDGLSYNILKSELEKKGYLICKNDCLEKAVKQWFIDSFFHYAKDKNDTEGKEIKDINSLKEHIDCNFVLKGDACIAYLNYKNAKRSKNYCLLAIIAAIFISLKDILLPLLRDCLCAIFSTLF
jgi:hypothetical protein